MRRVTGDIIENIDQHEKDGDKKCHAARDYLRGNQEAHLKDLFISIPYKVGIFCVLTQDTTTNSPEGR